MNILQVQLSHLVASGQPRPLLTAEVDRLASSIKEIGLIQPITVTPAAVQHGIVEQGWRIVAGHHRVAAVRALGWKEIDAIVIDNEKNLQNELVEIDENLCRAELTTAQRRSFTKRREQIWEALHPALSEIKTGEVGESATSCRTLPNTKPKTGRGNIQFAAITEAATGQNKRTTQRALASANALGLDVLSKVTNTSLDSGVELDALAKLPEPARAELIERAVAGEKVSAKPAATAPAQQPVKQPEKSHVIVQTTSIAVAIRKALLGVLDDFGCLSVRDLIPIIQAQDAQEEVQEIFESWNQAVYPVDVMAMIGPG